MIGLGFPLATAGAREGGREGRRQRAFCPGALDRASRPAKGKDYSHASRKVRKEAGKVPGEAA